MGGWTRLWLVITVATIALQALNYNNDVDSGRRLADEAYRSTVSTGDNCQPQTGRHNFTPKTLDDYLRGGPADCPLMKNLPTWPQTLRHAAQTRDQAIAQARSQSASYAIQFVLWVSGLLGAFLVSIGWIRQGFRKR